MDTREPDWALYRAFLAVLEEGTLSGAARALGLTQPTLGRQIEALEQALGVALFTRSRLGLSPTDTALTLRPYAESLRATAEALRRAANGTAASRRGRVRITASEIVGTEVLPGVLTRLRRAQPGIDIELVLSNRLQDLVLRDADIAVRMARPTQSALLARRIGTIPIGLHARPDYLEQHGVPSDLEALSRHALIGFDRATAFIRVIQDKGLPLRREMFGFCSDSDTAQMAAIRAGFGIGICQVPLALRDGLTRVMPKIEFGLDTWVAMHEDLRASPCCRITFDALVDGLKAYLGS